MGWIRTILDDDDPAEEEDEDTMLAALHMRDPSLEMSEMQSALEAELVDVKNATLEVMAARYGEFAKVADAVSSSFDDETRVSLVELRNAVSEARETFRKRKDALMLELEQKKLAKKRHQEMQAVQRFRLLLDELEQGLGAEKKNVERIAHAALALKAQLTGALEFVSDGALLTQLHEHASRVDIAETKTRDAVESEFDASCCCVGGGDLSPEPCLRAAAALGLGARLEHHFATKVMGPFIDATYTPGRLDGAVPGSRSGLASIFAATFDYVRDRAGPAIRACDDVLGLEENDFHLLAVDILVNAVWDPVAVAMESLSLFDLGIAEEIHHTVASTMAFVDDLASLSDERGRARLRSSDATRRLLEKWNLPVYFELVKVDTLTLLDEVSTTSKKEHPSSFAVATVEAIGKLWDPSAAYLRPIAADALKFTFELIDQALAHLTAQKLIDALTSASVAVDARYITRSVSAIFAVDEGAFFRALHEDNMSDMDKINDVVTTSVTTALAPYKEVLKTAMASLAEHLADDVANGLRLVKSVTARYHLTNAPQPTKPSDYLAVHAFKPLDDFETTWRPLLGAENLDAMFFSRHNQKVATNYATQVQAVLDHATKFQATLEKRRKAREGKRLDLAGDAVKIASQLLFDVDATVQRLALFASSGDDDVSPLSEIQTTLRTIVSDPPVSDEI